MKFKLTRTSDLFCNDLSMGLTREDLKKYNLTMDDEGCIWCEINTLESLIDFVYHYGQIVIGFDDFDYKIEIYDDYRE